MNMIKIKINEMPIEVQEGTTIHDAAKKLKIKIPTLCYHPDLSVAGNCRICVVEVKGSRTLVPSCSMPVADGMEIYTNTLKVRKARKDVIELLLAEHNMDCTKCYKNCNCELQAIAKEYISENDRFIDVAIKKHIDKSSPAYQKDDS